MNFSSHFFQDTNEREWFYFRFSSTVVLKMSQDKFLNVGDHVLISRLDKKEKSNNKS